MARFNEILVGRYNRLMQKLFSMKGPAALVTLSDELFAVLPMFMGLENRYLEQWETFSFSGFQAAVAANAGGVRIRNPIGSNVIAVIESIKVFESGGIDQPNLDHLNGAPQSDLANVQNIIGSALDTRSRQTPSCIISTASPAPSIGTTQATFAILANTTIELIQTEDQEQLLLPGCLLQIRALTVNQAINVSYRWRERFLEDSERQ